MVEAGVDPEGIRLLCRHLVNLKNQNAERRWFDWNLASQQNAAFAKVAVLVPLQLILTTESNGNEMALSNRERQAEPMLRMGNGTFHGYAKLFHVSPFWRSTKNPVSYDGHGFRGFSLGYAFSPNGALPFVTPKTAASHAAHGIRGALQVAKLFPFTVPPLVMKSHAIGGAA